MRRLLALGVVLISCSLCPAADKEQKTATVPDLIQQLFSNDYHARQHAAKQLGNLGLAARDAVPALGKLLNDVYPDVRISAAKALGQIGTPAVNVLVEALKARDVGVRTRAAQALGQAGPDAKDAVPALIAALKDKQTDVRVAAVDALREMASEGKEAAPQLACLFHDPSVRVREHVRMALAAIGPAAVEPLCDALGEANAEVRMDAIKTIVMFGPAAKKAVPALRHAMKDEKHRIRAAAAEALGTMELNAADAVPELLHALRDKDRDVHDRAANALVILTAAGVPGLLEKVRLAEDPKRWLQLTPPLKGTAGAQNPIISLMIKKLADSNAQERCKAALTLGEMAKQAVVALPALNHALEDDNVQVRLSVAAAIARIRRSKAEADLPLQRVLRQLKERLEDVRALMGLPYNEELYSPAAQARLRDFVRSYIILKVTLRSWNTSAEYEQALGQLGQESVPALVDGVNVVAGLGLGDC